MWLYRQHEYLLVSYSYNSPFPTHPEPLAWEYHLNTLYRSVINTWGVCLCFRMRVEYIWNIMCFECEKYFCNYRNISHQFPAPLQPQAPITQTSCLRTVATTTQTTWICTMIAPTVTPPLPSTLLRCRTLAFLIGNFLMPLEYRVCKWHHHTKKVFRNIPVYCAAKKNYFVALASHWATEKSWFNAVWLD